MAFTLEYGRHFHRIEPLSEVNGQMRVLDLQGVDVCEAVPAHSGSVEAICNSKAGVDYDG